MFIHNVRATMPKRRRSPSGLHQTKCPRDLLRQSRIDNPAEDRSTALSGASSLSPVRHATAQKTRLHPTNPRTKHTIHLYYLHLRDEARLSVVCLTSVWRIQQWTQVTAGRDLPRDGHKEIYRKKSFLSASSAKIRGRNFLPTQNIRKHQRCHDRRVGFNDVLRGGRLELAPGDLLVR